MANKYDDNDGKHLTKIIDSLACSKHGADIGDACWNVISRNGIMRAICDKRARLAGANGDVTPYHNRKEYSR